MTVWFNVVFIDVRTILVSCVCVRACVRACVCARWLSLHTIFAEAELNTGLQGLFNYCIAILINYDFGLYVSFAVALHLLWPG